MTIAILLALLQAPSPLVDATKIDSRFVIDIRYATADNFTGRVLYPVARCLLRAEVGEMLKRAQANLDEKHPGFVLMLKDCYRPASIQRLMWDVVKGTPKQSYVADPNTKTGSVHNYGAAVDLTLADPQGHEVDMGTPYDFFGIEAEPRHEAELVKSGKLTAAAVANRQILRDVMVAGGFKNIPNEWWHFDALQGKALRAKYEILDLPLSEAAPE